MDASTNSSGDTSFERRRATAWLAVILMNSLVVSLIAKFRLDGVNTLTSLGSEDADKGRVSELIFGCAVDLHT